MSEPGKSPDSGRFSVAKVILFLVAVAVALAVLVFGTCLLMLSR